MLQPIIDHSLVEQCLTGRAKRLRFPAAIEAAYEEYTRRYRNRVARSIVLPSVVTYNSFLPVHFFLLANTAWLATILHVCVVTPLILLGGLIARKELRLGVLEAFTVAVPVAMVAQIMAIFALNHSEAADHYQYLSIIILVNMNVTLRPGFRYAVGGSALLTAVYLALLLPSQSPFAVKLIGAASMLAVSYVTLMANRRMERDNRFAFLRRLQDQFYRQEAEAAAGKDALTGLTNRRGLDVRLAQLWGSEAAKTLEVAILMLDVDHFKAFNDLYGHLAGDLCLKRLANCIASALQAKADIVGRFGGEEFVVILPGIGSSAAIGTAERIRRAIEGLAIPHESAGTAGVVTASIGVMAGTVVAHGAAELIAGADAALYAAKRAGRNRVWASLVPTDTAVAA